MSTIRVSNVAFDSAETNMITYKQDQVIRVVTTGALKLPLGGVGVRPAVSESGLFRYNTDTDSLEYRDSSVWIRIEKKTVSNVTPSGGFDGDVWYKV